MNNAPKKPCRHCNGSGEEVDQAAIGAQMRARRKAAGISLREIARRLGITASYLADMEKGARNWTAERMEAYPK